MKVNLNIPVVGLDGLEIAGSNLGQILATNLANANNIDAMLSVSIAIDLWQGIPVELDDSELRFLINFVKNNQMFSSLIEYRILENLH